MFAVLALTALVSLGVAGCGSGPSVSELRGQGYTGCKHFADYVAAQMNDPSVKCIEDDKLIEFKDSAYYTGVCPDPNWC
jgi:hypothetical protein